MQRCIPDVRSLTTKETLKPQNFHTLLQTFMVLNYTCSMHFSTLNSKESQSLKITKIVSFNQPLPSCKMRLFD